jgi:hypothetical protein
MLNIASWASRVHIHECRRRCPSPPRARRASHERGHNLLPPSLAPTYADLVTNATITYCRGCSMLMSRMSPSPTNATSRHPRPRVSRPLQNNNKLGRDGVPHDTTFILSPSWHDVVAMQHDDEMLPRCKKAELQRTNVELLEAFIMMSNVCKHCVDACKQKLVMFVNKISHDYA